MIDALDGKRVIAIAPLRAPALRFALSRELGAEVVITASSAANVRSITGEWDGKMLAATQDLTVLRCACGALAVKRGNRTIGPEWASGIGLHAQASGRSSRPGSLGFYQQSDTFHTTKKHPWSPAESPASPLHICDKNATFKCQFGDARCP